ncbi:acyltransferase family protein [Roseiarcaceae bacterium H3SJ34-1]|uniref:acyltransferase family protein n=1 Tax=Terripilifer ovatus TaxID=3032367 RepID=UPI003AB9297A|nr:acyltransferase family protein [Roseiarcaceae bacterium H3SJ34-1]
MFPLLMIGLARFGPRAATWVIGGIALASLAVSVIGVKYAPGATFYLLPARTWEILLGALVARGNFNVFDNAGIRQAAAAVGAALIVAPIFLYTEATPFPGLAALPPCLGTAMLIAAGSRGSTAVGAALSVRPVVFVGLISYSLYLWHWPVIVLMQEALPAPNLARIWKIAAILLSFGLAVFSWRYIEQPFRVRKFEPRTIFRLSGIGIAAATAVGALVVATQGLPTRFSPDVAKIAGYLGYVSHNREGQCFLNSYDKFAAFQPDVCLVRSSEKPNVLLMGDSHAAHLWTGLNARFSNINLMQADAVGCKPVFSQRPRALASCTELMNHIFKTFLPAGKVDVLIISANWDAGDVEPLRETLVALRASGVRVLVSGPTVGYDLPLPQLMAIGLERGIPDFADRHVVTDRADLDARMEKMTREAGTEYVSIYRYLCGSGECAKTARDGIPIAFDSSHFTAEGSAYVAHAFDQILGKIIVSGPLVAN